MTYYWPTGLGWILIGVCCAFAFVAGGWIGLLFMVGFFAYVSLMGNVLLR
jgi:hypothetical protein